MKNELFFQVWMIYRDHWGVENHRETMRRIGRDKLKRTIEDSVNVRHLVFLYGHFHTRHLAKDVMKHVKDFADACMGDEIDFFKTGQTYHPLYRDCDPPSVRYYQSLGSPVMHFTGARCGCLQRVYALVALVP